MASNSKRERIIQSVIAALSELDWVTTIVREQPGEPSDLNAYAQTEFPVVAVVGRLPEVVEARQAGRAKEFKSTLRVDLYVYAMESATPDEKVSSMADDIWAAVHADPRRGGAAMDSTMAPDMDKSTYAPFVAFSMTARVSYVHDSRGI